MLPLLLATTLAASIPAALSQCLTSSSLTFADKPTVAKGLAASVIYNGLTKPRDIKFDDSQNLLVVDAGVGVISLSLSRSCLGWQRQVVVNDSSLNHGLELGGGSLYASSPTAVYRYTYNTSTTSVGTPSTFVTGLGGGTDAERNNTHTLLYQAASGSKPAWLYVTVSSDSDVDIAAASASSGIAQVRRFAINGSVPTGGYSFMSGELVAYGLRNAVGMTLDTTGRFWAVDNGADNATWDGINVDANNPADEVNMVNLTSGMGRSYGYPDCDTAWNLTAFNGPATGSQFAAVNSVNSTYCQNPANNVPPMLSLEAHAAPLDIKFYNGPSAAVTSLGFVKGWIGNAFISFHGSANRVPERGFGVVMAPYTRYDVPTANVSSQNGYSYIIQAGNLTACPGSCIRPVGLAFDRYGRLFVSSDATGEIFALYAGSQ